MPADADTESRCPVATKGPGQKVVLGIRADREEWGRTDRRVESVHSNEESWCAPGSGDGAGSARLDGL